MTTRGKGNGRARRAVPLQRKCDGKGRGNGRRTLRTTREECGTRKNNDVKIKGRNEKADPSRGRKRRIRDANPSADWQF